RLGTGARVRVAGHFEVRSPIGAVIAHGHEAVAGVVDEDPVGVAPEVAPAHVAERRDPGGLPAGPRAPGALVAQTVVTASARSTLLSALNAARRPSGERLALRVWRASTWPVSARLSKRTSGPRFCSTCAVNGISLACPEAMSTRMILPL